MAGRRRPTTNAVGCLARTRRSTAAGTEPPAAAIDARPRRPGPSSASTASRTRTQAVAPPSACPPSAPRPTPHGPVARRARASARRPRGRPRSPRGVVRPGPPRPRRCSERARRGPSCRRPLTCPGSRSSPQPPAPPAGPRRSRRPVSSPSSFAAATRAPIASAEKVDGLARARVIPTVRRTTAGVASGARSARAAAAAMEPSPTVTPRSPSPIAASRSRSSSRASATRGSAPIRSSRSSSPVIPTARSRPVERRARRRVEPAAIAVVDAHHGERRAGHLEARRELPDVWPVHLHAERGQAAWTRR